MDGEHVVERGLIEEMIKAFTVGGEASERVPITTEPVVAEVGKVMYVAPYADQAA